MPGEDIDTDLVVRRHGRPHAEAPTLLLLHGLTDSGSAWPDAIDHWGERYSILTVDQRGHGGSPRFTPEQLERHPGDVMVDDLLGVLGQLPQAPVVLGHSLGGAVALAAAVRRPDLVRALVLEDPAPASPGEPARSFDRGQEYAEGARVSLAAADDEALLEVRRVKHPTWSDSELLATGKAEQQTDLDYLEYGDIRPTTPWPDLFSKLVVPVLVVSGDALDEVCITGEVEQGIADLGNPNVTVVRIDDAAHCIRREQPAEFYRVVDEWLLLR